MFIYLVAWLASSYVQCQAKKAVKESVQNSPLDALFNSPLFIVMLHFIYISKACKLQFALFQ